MTEFDETIWHVEDGVEIEPLKDGQFLTVSETLTRVGVSDKNSDTLYQTCHVLCRGGKYYIIHFKGLFELDGKTAEFERKDWVRQNQIALMLQEWGMIKTKEEIEPESLIADERMPSIKVIKHSEKDEWKLVQKFSFNKHKSQENANNKGKRK